MEVSKLIWNNEARAGSMGCNVNVVPSKNVRLIIDAINNQHKKESEELVNKIEIEILNSTSVMFRPHLTAVFAVIRDNLSK